MMRLTSVLLLYVSLNQVICQSTDVVVDQSVANRYAEDIFRKTVKVLKDRIKLPKHKLTVASMQGDKIITAVCNLEEGYLVNMERMKRRKNVETDFTNRHMILKMPTEFRNMAVEYDLILKVNETVHRAKLSAIIASPYIVSIVKIPKNSSVAELSGVFVRHLSGVKVDVFRMSGVVWPRSVFVGKFIQFLNYEIAIFIEKYLKDLMKPIVANTPYPSTWT